MAQDGHRRAIYGLVSLEATGALRPDVQRMQARETTVNNQRETAFQGNVWSGQDLGEVDAGRCKQRAGKSRAIGFGTRRYMPASAYFRDMKEGEVARGREDFVRSLP